MTKEEAVRTIIMKSFPGVKTIEQYYVSGKRIDPHLPDHELAIEINEKGHVDRDEKEEKKKEERIKKILVVKLIE